MASMICFFNNFPAEQKIWPKQRLFGALVELGNQFSRSKKI